MSDVLQLDPFGNDAVEMTVTGEELRQMILSCGRNDGYGFPRVAGICYDVYYDKIDSVRIKDVKLYGPDRKKLNLKKSYRLVTNSYVASICDAPRKDQGKNMNRQTADMIIEYLSKQPSINYQGVRRTRRLSK